jgi:hypothetical protein
MTISASCAPGKSGDGDTFSIEMQARLLTLSHSEKEDSLNCEVGIQHYSGIKSPKITERRLACDTDTFDARKPIHISPFRAPFAILLSVRVIQLSTKLGLL